MNVTSSPPAARPVRRRRWLRYALVFLTVLAGGAALGYFYVTWSFENDLQAAIAETDALDPRWRLEDIEADRKTYRDEENAALHTIAVVKLLGRSAVSSHPNYADLFDDDYPPQHQLNSLQMALIREAFERMEAARLEARKLKDMSGGRFPIAYAPDFISTLMPNQQNARQSMELLHHDAMFRAQNGDADGAVESCQALINAGRALGDEPLLISFLIRAAGDTITMKTVERVLAQGFPKPEPLADMQRRLAQERPDAAHHWRQSMRGERAGHHHLANSIMAGKMRLSHFNGPMGPGGPGMIDRFGDYFPLAFTRGYPNHLRYLNQGVEATKLPDAEQIDRFAELEKTIHSQSMFTRLLAPAMGKIARAHLRTQAYLGATEAALACERFRIEHQRWPETLEELVKSGMIDAVPPDPFDGRPLRYRKLADGAAVYSVGFDKQDNGGAINRARPEEAGTDLGMRLWDPARRRQPPLPPAPRQP